MRVRMALLAAVLGLGSIPLALFAGASPAAASTGCPPGTITAREPMTETSTILNLICLDSKGNYLGYLNPNTSEFTLQSSSAEAMQLSEPSSALVDTTAGASADEVEGLLTVDATAGEGTAMVFGGEAIAGVAGAGYGGYLVGKAGMGLLCDHGWAGKVLSYATAGSVSSSTLQDLECGVQKAPLTSYTPNGDVVLHPAGWVGTMPISLPTDNMLNVEVDPDPAAYKYHSSTPAKDTTSPWTYTTTTDNSRSNSQEGIRLEVVCDLAAPYQGSTQVDIGEILFGNYAGGTYPKGGYHGTGAYATGQGCTAGAYYNGNSANPKMLGIAYVYVDAVDWYNGTNYGGTYTRSSAIAKWYPVGAPGRPADTTANPTRVLRATNTCSDGSTTHVDSATYTDTDSGGYLPQIGAPPSCPAGTTVTSYVLQSINLQTGKATNIFGPTSTPGSLNTFRQNNPSCASGECRLGLYKILPDGTYDSCFKSNGLPGTTCAGWLADPTKTQDYQCTFGPLNTSADPHVPLSDCNAYGPSFDPSKQAAGVAYGDPATGKSPDTRTPQPSPSSDPGTTTTTDPTTDPDPSTPLPGQSGSSCWPSGFSQVFNPMEWVLKPVECALVWAFVPDTETVAKLIDDISNGGPGTDVTAWSSAFQGLFTPIGDPGQTCDGLPVHLDLGPMTKDFTLLASCDEPMRTVASVSYGFTSFVVVIMGGLACLRGLTQPFGLAITIGQNTKVLSR